MSRHDDSIRLRHMLEHASEAVEIVGEAAARISPEVRGRHPLIPWSQITGARNHLIHGYDRVDHRVLWDIIKLDLPSLIIELRSILEPPEH